jgi:hypothetical protein
MNLSGGDGTGSKSGIGEVAKGCSAPQPRVLWVMVRMCAELAQEAEGKSAWEDNRLHKAHG